MAIINGRKWCNKCGKTKPVAEFYRAAASPDGLRPRCKPCHADDNRLFAVQRARRLKEWRAENPEKWKAQIFRANRRKKKYGLRFDERVAFREAHGRCGACGKTSDLVIDHCHGSGRLRGVLCRSCNMGLGQIGDTEEALVRMLAYLRKSSPQQSHVAGASVTPCATDPLYRNGTSEKLVAATP